jgi:ComF family protein
VNIFGGLINIIYPPRCPVCGLFLWKDRGRAGGTDLLFCRTCLADFRNITSPFCTICGTPFSSIDGNDHRCEDCLRKRPLFQSIQVPFLYDGPLLTAIHQFKYGSKSFLAGSLGPLLARFAATRVEPSDDLVTIPVPLHPKRLRERGFNQSLLLARHVAQGLRTELDFLALRRVRYTTPQTGLGKEARRRNVSKAFEVRDPGAVKGKRVLLVDDVATTGSTLNECARVLRKAGCKEVSCLVLARTGGM